MDNTTVSMAAGVTVGVADRHLAPAVGTEKRQAAVLAHRCRLPHDGVGELDRPVSGAGCRAGVAEHHPLVAGALGLCGAPVHAASDVGGAGYDDPSPRRRRNLVAELAMRLAR